MWISKNKLRNERKKSRAIDKISKFKDNEIVNINIKKPTKQKEIYIQFNLYNRLKLLGYDVYMEVSHTIEGRSMARFDIVIFNPKWDLIVEIKRKWWKVTNKQVIKYCKFNADLIFCIGKSQIEETINYINEKYK